MSDLVTIRDIANQLGTDKNVVYRIIKKLDIAPSTREHSANASEHSRTLKANAPKYYDPEIVNIVKTELERMRADKTTDNAEHSESTREHSANTSEHFSSTREHSRTPEPNTELIDVLRAQIDGLNRQIEMQAATISHHEETISNLTALLAHEQELNKAQLLLTASTKRSIWAKLTDKFKKNEEPGTDSMS